MLNGHDDIFSFQKGFVVLYCQSSSYLNDHLIVFRILKSCPFPLSLGFAFFLGGRGWEDGYLLG